MCTQARVAVTVPEDASQLKAGPLTVAQIIEDLADSWGDGPLTEEELEWARRRLRR